MPNYLGWNGHYVAIGYERDGTLKGGVVYTQYSHPNIVVATVLEAPLTRGFLREIFHYPFIQMKCRRMTALIDAKNARSRQLVEHIGFKLEGCMREAALEDDVMIYGLLKSDCKWLPT